MAFAAVVYSAVTGVALPTVTPTDTWAPVESKITTEVLPDAIPAIVKVDPLTPALATVALLLLVA